MRREGRQHGMVRTYHVIPAPLNPRPPSRIINKLESPPTAGLFTKVSNKPTNHSKFTGKCDRSVHKSKGTHKLRSNDAVLNYSHLTWRATPHRHPHVSVHKLPVSGFSASDILHELDDDHHYHDYDDDDGYYDDDHHHLSDDANHAILETEIVDDQRKVGQIENDDDNDVDDDDDESDLGFYDVAVVWDPVDEYEGWSLVVGEM